LEGLDDYECEGSLIADEKNSYGRTPIDIISSSISSSDSVYSAISSSLVIITLHNLDNEPFGFSFQDGESFIYLAWGNPTDKLEEIQPLGLELNLSYLSSGSYEIPITVSNLSELQVSSKYLLSVYNIC